MGNIFLQTEDSPLPEVHWLVYDGSQDLDIVEIFGRDSVGENLWSLQNSCLNGVWLKLDIKVPFLDFLGCSNHAV